MMSGIPDFARNRMPMPALTAALFCAFGGAAAPALAQATDSAAAVFRNDQVQSYELRFFTPAWADSLEKNKESLDEVYMPARFLWRNAAGDSVVLDSIGVRYKGNSSYNLTSNSPKKPFKFRFDKYRKGQRFFGMERLNFSNGANDPSFMREKISYDVARTFLPAPRASFANLTIEGRLLGFYLQVEQVDKIFLGRHFADNDGNLYKSGDNGANLSYLGANQTPYKADYELKTNTTADDWSRFILLLDKLNNVPAPSFPAEAGKLLAFGNAIRHLALTTVFSHFDSYTGSGRNYYLYDDPKSKRFHLIPWDLNLSFGAHTNNWNVVTLDIVNIPNLAQRPLNRRLLENDSLKKAYLDMVAALISGPASRDSIAARADALKPLLDPHVKADTNKLFSYENFLANIEEDIVFMDGPRRTVIPGIKAFSGKRNAAIAGQLAQQLGIVSRGRLFQGGLRLEAGFPGPDGALRIRFDVGARKLPAKIRVLDLRGRDIALLLDEAVPAPGAREIAWRPATGARGLFLIRMDAGEASATVPIAFLP